MVQMNANDNWYLWAVLVVLGFFVLLWIFTEILKILIIPIAFVGIIGLLFGLIFREERLVIYGVVAIIIALVALVLVSVITHSSLWESAQSLGQGITSMAKTAGEVSSQKP
jgi:hypothetical protein